MVGCTFAYVSHFVLLCYVIPAMTIALITYDSNNITSNFCMQTMGLALGDHLCIYAEVWAPIHLFSILFKTWIQPQNQNLDSKLATMTITTTTLDLGNTYKGMVSHILEMIYICFPCSNRTSFILTLARHSGWLPCPEEHNGSGLVFR